MAAVLQEAYNTDLTPEDVNLTPAAAEKMVELFKDIEDDVAAIRIFVAGGGCDGMTYSMTFTDTKSEHDAVMVLMCMSMPLP